MADCVREVLEIVVTKIQRFDIRTGGCQGLKEVSGFVILVNNLQSLDERQTVGQEGVAVVFLS